MRARSSCSAPSVIRNTYKYNNVLDKSSVLELGKGYMVVYFLAAESDPLAAHAGDQEYLQRKIFLIELDKPGTTKGDTVPAVAEQCHICWIFG